jgi:hypothetical protein
MKFAPQEDRDHQRAMLDVELDMANGPLTPTRGLGFSSRDQWQAFEDSLLKYGGMKSPTDVDKATNETFLQSITKDGHIVWP